MGSSIVGMIKLSDRTKTRIRVYRANNGKQETPSIIWKIRQFIREMFLKFTNIFRSEKNKKFATVLTSVGEGFIVDKLMESTNLKANYIGQGTGSGNHSKDSTALFQEAPEDRVIATESKVNGDTYRIVGTLTAIASKTITEVGTFTASTGGTLVIASDFPGIPLNTGDKIEFTIDMEVS